MSSQFLRDQAQMRLQIAELVKDLKAANELIVELTLRVKSLEGKKTLHLKGKDGQQRPDSSD